jgi:hypothetical protein
MVIQVNIRGWGERGLEHSWLPPMPTTYAHYLCPLPMPTAYAHCLCPLPMPFGSERLHLSGYSQRLGPRPKNPE